MYKSKLTGKCDTKATFFCLFFLRRMVEGDYYVRVAVDGKDVPLQNHCGGNPNSGDCRFTVSIYFSIGCICINLKYKLLKDFH